MTSGWIETDLGHLIRLQRGYDLPEQHREPGSFPVVGSAGPNGTHSKARAEGPGVVVGRSGASVGKVHFVPSDFWPHNTGMFVTDFLGNDPRFVAYYLSTLDLAAFNSGSAQPSLNRNFLYTCPVVVPPLPTQQRIAAILSAYDDLIENNTRRIAILEEMARRLYEEWFVNPRPQVGEQLDGWSWTTLGELCSSSGGSIQTGPFGSQLHQEDYATEGVAVVMPKDIRNGRVDHERCARIADEDASRLQRHRLKPMDLVFARRGEIGRKALIREHEEGSVCGTGCLKVRLGKAPLSPYFVAEYMSEGTVVQELEGRAIGATMANLNTGILSETPIPLPPENHLSRFHLLSVGFDGLSTSLHRKNANLRAQRDMLLPKLISGEIDVSGAEELLEAAE